MVLVEAEELIEVGVDVNLPEKQVEEEIGGNENAK